MQPHYIERFCHNYLTSKSEFYLLTTSVKVKFMIDSCDGAHCPEEEGGSVHQSSVHLDGTGLGQIGTIPWKFASLRHLQGFKL